MKNLIQLFFAIIISSVSFSQSFDGVPISGNFNTCLNLLKAKNYKVVQIMKDNDAASLTGRYNNTDIQLLVLSTPKTKRVCTFAIYMPKEKTFENLEREFQKYYEIFYEKYGEPDVFKREFLSPYEDGDGYELSAITNEKATIRATWFNKDNKTIRLSISKYSEINISYDNHINILQYTKERDEINKEMF